jgi:hypothetical protein
LATRNLAKITGVVASEVNGMTRRFWRSHASARVLGLLGVVAGLVVVGAAWWQERGPSRVAHAEGMALAAPDSTPSRVVGRSSHVLPLRAVPLQSPPDCGCWSPTLRRPSCSIWIEEASGESPDCRQTASGASASCRSASTRSYSPCVSVPAARRRRAYTWCAAAAPPRLRSAGPCRRCHRAMAKAYGCSATSPRTVARSARSRSTAGRRERPGRPRAEPAWLRNSRPGCSSTTQARAGATRTTRFSSRTDASFGSPTSRPSRSSANSF